MILLEKSNFIVNAEPYNGLFGEKKMGAISQSVIASGFVETTDTPEMLLTAILIGVAYMGLLAIPATYLLRLEGKKWKKEMAFGLCFTAIAPFLFRGVAMVVQGRHWSDWHFIWLYLLASALAAGCYLLALLVWNRLKGRGANHCQCRENVRLPIDIRCPARQTSDV